MLRKLLVLLVLSLGLSSAAQAQTTTRREHTSLTPAWLPRGILLGASFRDDTITPRLKLQWQFTFYQDRQDAFVLLLEGGLGWAASMPTLDPREPRTKLGSYYEHTAQVGVGYRNHFREGLHWGFQVTGGPVFYGAHFDGEPADKRTAGIVEGRIHVGYQLDKVAFGVAAGYGEPFGLKRRSLGRTFVGGPMFGLFADWR